MIEILTMLLAIIVGSTSFVFIEKWAESAENEYRRHCRKIYCLLAFIPMIGGSYLLTLKQFQSKYVDAFCGLVLICIVGIGWHIWKCSLIKREHRAAAEGKSDIDDA